MFEYITENPQFITNGFILAGIVKPVTDWTWIKMKTKRKTGVMKQTLNWNQKRIDYNKIK